MITVKNQCKYNCNKSFECGQTGINDLPPEMLYEIFSNLDNVDLSTCRKVNRIWYLICNHLLKISVIRGITFGKKEWDKHIGVVEEPPPLPKNLHEIVEEVYRGIGKEKKIKETLMLQLIPKTVNGKPYCLDLLLEELFPEHNIQSSYNSQIKEKFGKKTLKKSYWVLYSKEPLSGTIGEKREKRIEIEGCRLPKLLEAATCALTYRITGEMRLRSTCCKDMVGNWITIVYDYGSIDQVDVEFYYNYISNVGASVLRKLNPHFSQHLA